jgi:dinuclear metal center YbgI/SA1388 family protein
MPRLADLIDVLDAHYPPRLAAAWDTVGLTCGDPDAEVNRVLFAVDPTRDVISEAIERRAELVVTHHPLLLRPVHSVAATGFKGRSVHRLISNGIALYTAHTNADSALPGVSDALAETIGLRVTGPLCPAPDGPPGTGIGRIGELSLAMPLYAFVRQVADMLPATVSGVRATGDSRRSIRTVAVCGGAGDDLFDAVRAAGVDAYLTSDLRHHPASEAMEHDATAPALIEVAHWAGEWPWLPRAAAVLRAGLPAGTTVETYVSARRTDPWTVHAKTVDLDQL